MNFIGILLLFSVCGFGAWADFELFLKSGGTSSYEVILLGHRHATDVNPNYIGDYEALERFVLRSSRIDGSNTAILLEGVGPSFRLQKPEKARILPLVPDRVLISGWDNEVLNTLNKTALDSIHNFGGSSFERLVVRYASELAFYELSRVHRNRHLMKAVAYYGGLGHRTIYVLAGTEHVLAQELVGYLSSSRIKHQIWVEKTHVETHGGILGVDPHSQDIEREQQMFEIPLKSTGVDMTMEEFRALGREGMETMLKAVFSRLGIEPLPPLRAKSKFESLSFELFERSPRCEAFL